MIESCTGSKALEFIDYVSCTVMNGTYSTNSKILDGVDDSIRVHRSEYMVQILNSKVSDRVHDLIRVHRAEYVVQILNSKVSDRVHDLKLVHAF